MAKERMQHEWKIWTEDRVVANDRHEWKDNTKALCATDTKSIGEVRTCFLRST